VNHPIHIPDSLTPADIEAVEAMIRQLADARELAAEWARRDGEKTKQLMNLIHKETVL